MKFKWIQLAFIVTAFICSCSNESNIDDNYSVFTEVDLLNDEDNEILDIIPTVDYTQKDLTLENGNDLFQFLSIYDPDFIDDNNWIKEYTEEHGRVAGSKVTGNAGIINLKNTVISEMIIGSVFYLNDAKGLTTNTLIAKKIADNNQKGLWYKWGGKVWDQLSYPTKGGEPLDGIDKKCYGLDCSGLVYAAMNKINFEIPVRNAAGYYSEELWNGALKKFLATKNMFPEEIKGNIKFQKFSYSCNQIVEKTQPGDLLFFGTSNIGHLGIVSNAKNLAQSNGKQHPEKAEYNYYNEPKKTFRGPRLVTLDNVAKYWGIKQFGVLRLVAELNNTHWQLNIKCDGRDTYITSFDIEINLQDDATYSVIEPVSTIGYDYTGEPCDVYFEGSFNRETQVLKGTVKKDYGNGDCRVDGFEVKLLDDSTSNIPMNKIQSNGGCYNMLDLVNIDNNNSRNNNIKVNNVNSVFEEYECKDSNY